MNARNALTRSIVARILTRICLILGSVLLGTLPAGAATFYVRSSGSDGSFGVSSETAFATIQRAADEMRGGDRVIVGPGIYQEGNIKPNGNGRADEPVIFFADRDGVLTEDPPGAVIVDAGPFGERTEGFRRGFDISGRPWIVLNGFTVRNATQEGIAIKSGSESSVVANCVVVSNGERGIRVRDSAKVIVFNNLVYDNGETGIEFGGDIDGASGATAFGNTVYGNGIGRARDNDGIRVDDDVPARKVVLLSNIVAGNGGIGLNLKEGSTKGFIGQWNLVFGNQVKDYTDPRVSRGALDLPQGPTFVAAGTSGGVTNKLGLSDEDFYLLSATEGVESNAVNATPLKPKKLGLQASSTRRDGIPDAETLDIGFHFRNKTDFLSGFRKPLRKRLSALKATARRCERLAGRAADQDRNDRGPCQKARSLRRLIRKCGTAVKGICG